MWKLWLFVTCALMFFYSASLQKKAPYHYSYKIKQKRIYAKAFIFGDKSQLKSKDKKLFKKLHLYHLLVPSGLHLSAIVSILSFLFQKKRLIKGIVGFCVQFLESFHSLKRMGLFYLFRGLFPRVPFYLSWLFAIALDFLRGSFGDNPLSFTLSYFFVSGILLSLKHHERVFSFLFFAQVFISLLMNSTLYPLNLIFSLISLPLHFLMYPLGLYDLLINENFFFTHYFEILGWINSWLGSLALEETLLKSFLLCFYFLNFKYLSFLALFWPLNISNIHPYYGKFSSFPGTQPQGWIKRIEKKSLTQYIYPSGMICRARLYRESWSVRCK